MWKFYIILAICYIVTAIVFYCVLWGVFSYIEYLLDKKRKSSKFMYFDTDSIKPKKKYWFFFRKHR